MEGNMISFLIRAATAVVNLVAIVIVAEFIVVAVRVIRDIVTVGVYEYRRRTAASA